METPITILEKHVKSLEDVITIIKEKKYINTRLTNEELERVILDTQEKIKEFNLAIDKLK